MSRINLLYPHSLELGYGRMAVKLVAAIERAGVSVFDDLPSAAPGSEKFIPHGSKSAICSHVGWMSTPGHARGWWKGQTRSILTMWESNILPEPFRESIDGFNTIVVPSEQNLELFSRYHSNVKYVPLGIDPVDWHPIERPVGDGPFFNFFISGGGYRKGSDLVIDAFRKVFDTWPSGKPIPRLFIHSRRADVHPADERIHLIAGTLTAEEEQALYGMAHCYVMPSRGEGFGLRPLQAIAQGCPTIATDAHGHKAFSHLLTHRLPWTLQETPPQSFHHGPAGSWWEPDFETLCDSMEDVYLNYDQWLPVAEENGQRAITELNWDVCAERYLDAIGRESLKLPDIEPEEWITPPLRRYLVRVNTSRLFEVGGIQYLMEPGRDYWEPADVKRVLFESGVLDISCLPQNLAGHLLDDGPGVIAELDSGLTAEQYERIPGYTASHVLCPTCHNKLNTNRPTLEELEAIPMPAEH